MIKDIKEWKGKYAISKDGKVWSYFNNRWLKSHTTKNSDWYYSIALGKGVKRKGYKVHRLVAQAFIPNPKNLLEVNHKNGDKTDNRIENLEWCTRKDNIAKGYKTLPNEKRNYQRGETNHWAKLTEKDVKEIRKIYKLFDRKYGSRALGKRFGVSSPTIQGIVQGRYWAHVL